MLQHTLILFFKNTRKGLQLISLPPSSLMTKLDIIRIHTRACCSASTGCDSLICMSQISEETVGTEGSASGKCERYISITWLIERFLECSRRQSQRIRRAASQVVHPPFVSHEAPRPRRERRTGCGYWGRQVVLPWIFPGLCHKTRGCNQQTPFVSFPPSTSIYGIVCWNIFVESPLSTKDSTDPFISGIDCGGAQWSRVRFLFLFFFRLKNVLRQRACCHTCQDKQSDITNFFFQINTVGKND